MKAENKSAATITINKAGLMSPKGRSQIAAWMRRTADDFEKLGGQYTHGRFRACYYYK